MVDFSQVKSAPIGSEGVHRSYFLGRDGEAARAVVESHPDAYFKLAAVTSAPNLKMVCDDVGITLLPEQTQTIQGTLCHFVARLHEVHLLVGAFAEQGQNLAPFYITPLAPYALTEQGLRPVHLSSLTEASLFTSAPLREEPSRIATSAFETALMRNHPHVAFVFEATSEVHDKQALSCQVDEQLLVLGGVLHTAQVPSQGVLFIARRDAAERVAKLDDVSVTLVRPLEVFASHYQAGDELNELPRINGRSQFESVPVSNGRISVLKLSQGAN